MSTRHLEAAFKPASIVIAGASDRPGSIGAQVTSNVRHSFNGPIWGINPRRPVIDGVTMLDAASALPSAPDLAIIVTPPHEVVETAQTLGALGVKAAVVITDPKRGTAPARDIRRALRTIADQTGMRIIGPNALGLASAHVRATMSRLAAPQGGLAFVGQATMAAGALTEWLAHQHLGFSGLLAAGDMVDVDYADAIDWFAADTRTRMIVVFMEHVPQSRRFLSAIRQAVRMKPVVVLRAEAAPLTAAQDAVFDAALRRAGAVRARSLEDLFALINAVAVRLPSDAPPTLGARLAIVSNGESFAALARLALDEADTELAALSQETVERLSAVLPPGRDRINPIDILPDASAERYANALKILSTDKSVDAVLAAFGPSGATSAAAIAEAIAAVVEEGRLQPGRRRPFVMAAFSGGAAEAEARAYLAARHISSFATPSEAVRAFDALVAMRRAAERVTATPEFLASIETSTLDEIESAAHAAADQDQSATAPHLATLTRKALALESFALSDMDALTWRIRVGNDPDFGMAIFFGPGGPFGEIARDVKAALPPLNAATAEDFIHTSPYIRSALKAGLIDTAGVHALSALMVRISDLIAGVPSLATMQIDSAGTAKGRTGSHSDNMSITFTKAPADPDSRFAIRPYPARYDQIVKNFDGTIYHLRPLRAEDEPALAKLAAKMTPEDLRLRFFQPMRTLTHEFAARLTQIDYDREMAFALFPEKGGDMLAVVRLHREPRGDSGEYAITVRSDMQGRGIGRMMMAQIIAYGRRQGLKSIFGLVLAENHGMLNLSRALGFTAKTDFEDPTIVRVELSLV